MNYFLSLGSNVGDRQKNLARALCLLEENGVEVLRKSFMYLTEPVDVLDQPWFINQAVEVASSLTPHELLELARRIEALLKRRRRQVKGPRTIDIDILLAGDTVIDTPELTIPHPHLPRRNFVLVPLAEIAPSARHPVLRKTVAAIARASQDPSKVLKWEAGASGRAPLRKTGVRRTR